MVTPAAYSARVNEVAGDSPDATRPDPRRRLRADHRLLARSGPTPSATSFMPGTAPGHSLHDDNGMHSADSDNSYTHTGLTAGTTIYYQGRSVNAGGTMSAWSAQVSATVLSAPTVSEPQTLVAASGSGQITLTWTAPASGAATGYHYRYGETGETMGAWTGIGNVLTVTVIRPRPTAPATTSRCAPTTAPAMDPPPPSAPPRRVCPTRREP